MHSVWNMFAQIVIANWQGLGGSKTLRFQENKQNWLVVKYLNTNLEVAKMRNETRPRALPEDVLVKSWNNVDGNLNLQ